MACTRVRAGSAEAKKEESAAVTHEAITSDCFDRLGESPDAEEEEGCGRVGRIRSAMSVNCINQQAHTTEGTEVSCLSWGGQ